MLINKELVHRISILLLSITGSAILLGCNSQEDQEVPTLNKTETLESSGKPDNTTSIVDSDDDKKLTIDAHRCIGCGKCVRVAPENFKMSGRKAIIVAEKKSAATTQAIKICPVNAISA